MSKKPKVWIIGFPRCGTVSLCEALQVLGWNPVHNPRHWDMLEGYDAAGDVFVTAHWRELFQMFPDSKFILNTRDVEDWLQSLTRIPGFWESPLLYDRFHRLVVYGTDDAKDHRTLRNEWERHHDEVKAAIPALQRLVFPLPFQWEPLCVFLGVSVPDRPFPWRNRNSNADVLVRVGESIMPVHWTNEASGAMTIGGSWQRPESMMSDLTASHAAPFVAKRGTSEDRLGASHVLAHLGSLLPVADLTAGGQRETEPRITDEVLGKGLADEMGRILFRSKRRHVLLVGECGVGKTTLLKTFACCVRQGAFGFLRGSRILLLDVANVGEEDSRACLESIFSAVDQSEDVILCLDGLASLMKRSHGGTNKPLLRTLLNRGRMKVIGTMTGWEYVEHVGSDAQMLETFTRVDLREPVGVELEGIVACAARDLAEEFAVAIPAEVVERTIAVTSTFLLSESHPAKSIDLLRQVCENICFESSQAGRPLRSTVTVNDVIDAVSCRTGIPRETVSGQGQKCDFERALCDAVVGQDGAVREVAAELQLISAGLTEPGRPASVMMFAGMTGVGKTELAKRVAELYSTSRQIQVYSMGNFTEAHSVSGIIGVPPGYVGHEEGGRLINELRADPYSVFLLDEAEKCHPNVWKPFLNLFDEGWIVDQRGVKAYANRAIFILTTNAGDRNISQLTRSGKSREEIGQNVRQALSRVRQERSSQPVFPAQFLSRMKRIIVFNALDESAMVGIAQCAGRRLCRRWRTGREKTVHLAPELIRRIGVCAHERNEKSNGQEGGRIVQKLFSDHVEHAIYRKSLEAYSAYERCGAIDVRLAEGESEVGIQTEITFRAREGPAGRVKAPRTTLQCGEEHCC